MTDCSFAAVGGRFYYCARAIIIRSGKLLVLKDDVAPHYYLPGGKVAMGETAEEAVVREVAEELGAKAEIVRPLWLCQNFFTQSVTGERYHELGLYFLTDICGGVPCGSFTVKEGAHTLSFEWVELEKLKDVFFYPEFIRHEILNLPENLTIVIEKE